MTKPIFVFLGIISLALGLLGTVLPLLPATPFFLLTFYCFARGSVRMNNWFTNTEIYRNYLSVYLKRKALTYRQKALILFFSNITMLISFLLLDHLPCRIFLIAACIVQYYIFLFRIKTYHPQRSVFKETSSPDALDTSSRQGTSSIHK